MSPRTLFISRLVGLYCILIALSMITRRQATVETVRGCAFLLTFLSDGWWSLVRPSSSYLTTASSSLVRSTVPISPVGFPKLPKASTRSPGLSSSLLADGSASGGFLARSTSGVAPWYDKGGWQLYAVLVSAFRCGYGLYSVVSFREARAAPFAA